MKSWIVMAVRLFCRRKEESLTEPVVQASVAIPVPEDYPEILLSRSKRPTKKGKTPEEYEAAALEYRDQIRLGAVASSKYARERAIKIGSKSYIWRAPKDSCDECLARDGKRYTWSKPPKGGHPGEKTGCPEGYCRCFAEPILPRNL